MTVITCEYCGKSVYRLTRTVHMGESPSSSAFEGINGFDSPEDGDAIECPSCNMPLLASIVAALRKQMVDNDE